MQTLPATPVPAGSDPPKRASPFKGVLCSFFEVNDLHHWVGYMILLYAGFSTGVQTGF